MLKHEKKKVQSEGVDALMHRLRKPQQADLNSKNFFDHVKLMQFLKIMVFITPDDLFKLLYDAANVKA